MTSPLDVDALCKDSSRRSVRISQLKRFCVFHIFLVIIYTKY